MLLVDPNDRNQSPVVLTTEWIHRAINSPVVSSGMISVDDNTLSAVTDIVVLLNR